jgi:hypothetical protein
MPSPFPGMNPYLEDPHIWEDFHANLAGEIQAMLNPKLRPKYVATLATRVTYEAVEIETKPQIIKPDVSILHTGPHSPQAEAVAIAPPPLIGQVIQEVPVPLLETDPDVPLDLGQAIDNIYDRAAYDLRLDYNEPPPLPDLPAELAAWLDEHLQAQGLRQIHEKN